MFFTILILSYTIPSLYLFIRLWQLFIEKKHRIVYIVVFIIIFLLYPAGMFLDGIPFLTAIAERLSHFILPLILYTFLSVLVTDILLLLNLVFKIVSWEKLRVRSFRYRYFAGIIVVSALISIGGIINFNTIRPSFYNISVPGTGSGKNIRVAFVSDFHLEADVPERFLKQYIRKMNEIGPDLVLYGGDIVEGSGEGIPGHEEILRSLKPPPFGVYGVMGNHDRFRDYRNNFFTRSGIVLLRDSVAIVGDLLAIAGRIDGRGPRKSAAELMNEVPGKLPAIFVDHRPTEIDQISKTAAFASFSGHTHKGQLFPVNWHLNSIYELSHGHLLKNNTHFFVSSGIRLWGPRVRTTGKSEILVVDIRFE
jgi:uncharacterized protein